MIFVTLIYQLSINKSRKISSTTNPAALSEYYPCLKWISQLLYP